MSDTRPETPRPPDPDDIARVEEIADLQGDAMPIDQDAFLEPDEFEKRREPTQTELDRGDAAPDREGVLGLASTLDMLAAEELREGETDDPDVATEEGLTYVPPSDPPIRADEEEPGGSRSRPEQPSPRSPSPTTRTTSRSCCRTSRI